MKRDYSILTTIWFLVGLLVLLLNDLVLKEAFANWFTGKLSDFTGLFIFPLFWTVLLPKHKNKIFWLTALFFTFWKSSYSQILIDSWNNLGLFGISRVVDYTDLIALSILPFAYFIQEKKEELRIIKVQPVFPIIVASFSFMATSYDTNVDVRKTYKFDVSKDSLKARFLKIDSFNYGNAVNFTDGPLDTIEISVPSELCFDQLETKIIVKEISDKKSQVILIQGHHRCPSEDNDNEEVLKAFEKQVVEKLKNPK